MGYTTTFTGKINITPKLNKKEIDYLKRFGETRRVHRQNGPYYATKKGAKEQGRDIIDYNSPPEGQPGLWCQWEPTEDGTALQWDGSEKFYSSVEWMQYLIKHFLQENPLAKALEPNNFKFLKGHTLNGTIEARGESQLDLWQLVVTNNVVETKRGRVVYE